MTRRLLGLTALVAILAQAGCAAAPVDRSGADVLQLRMATIDGYDALVIQIGNLAAKYGKPVLLIEGDSHVFRVDTPFTPSSPLFGLHPNTPVAPNVTRLVVNGSSSRTEYVRLTINPNAKKGTSPFTFIEVPL